MSNAFHEPGVGMSFEGQEEHLPPLHAAGFQQLRRELAATGEDSKLIRHVPVSAYTGPGKTSCG